MFIHVCRTKCISQVLVKNRIKLLFLLLLQSKVPITEEVNVPYDFHRFIIGQKGRDVRRMMEDHDVNISIPPADEHSDIVRITGAPENVKCAVAALEERVQQLEEKVCPHVLVCVTASVIVSLGKCLFCRGVRIADKGAS